MRNIPWARGARPGRTSLIAISLLALTGALTMRSARSVPLTVYGHLPNLENVALSPDGSRLAYVRTDGDVRTIAVANVADHKIIGWVRVGEEKLRGIRWADDDNLLFSTSGTASVYGFKDEWSLLRDYNVSRNEARSLPGTPVGSTREVLNTIVGDVGDVMVRRIDNHTVLFVPGLYKSIPGMFQEGDVALFRCDLTTGHTTAARVGQYDHGWLVDGEGQLAAQEDYDEQTQHWSIRVFRGNYPMEAASGHAALDIPEILGFGPTPDTVLVESIEHGDRLWQLLSIKDGKFSPMPPGTVFDEPIRGRLTDRLIGGVDIDDFPQYVFLDPARESRWKAVISALDGDALRLVSYSSDFSRVVVLVDGPNYGYRYILIDLDKSSAVPIGKVYDGIDKPLGKRRITYAAGDGLQIPAYLTLPQGRPPHALPLIVLVHGGPADRDGAEFDWWSQALADQGYAVLQPNYRGSNLSESFLEAGFGQWGRKMQTDLSDGVLYLVKQGIVDPAKVCIVGASYGGYAALAGVTLQPTVYRCAVSVAGLSDLAGFLRWQHRGGVEARYVTRYWDRYWGVSGSGDPALNAINPIKHVDAVRAPVLLIHGRDDTVVPYEQSQVMFDALQGEKKDVQMVTLKREDHWLSRSETRLQMLQATVDFLKAHDPPN